MEIVGAYMLSVHILIISKFLLIVINSWLLPPSNGANLLIIFEVNNEQ